MERARRLLEARENAGERRPARTGRGASPRRGLAAPPARCPRYPREGGRKRAGLDSGRVRFEKRRAGRAAPAGVVAEPLVQRGRRRRGGEPLPGALLQRSGWGRVPDRILNASSVRFDGDEKAPQLAPHAPRLAPRLPARGGSRRSRRPGRTPASGTRTTATASMRVSTRDSTTTTRARPTRRATPSWACPTRPWTGSSGATRRLHWWFRAVRRTTTRWW